MERQEPSQGKSIPVASTLYHRVGGDSFFTSLVDRFYQAVERDPLLRPQYPEDLEPGKKHLAAFLAQFFGGPPHYAEERGAPRLRMRHHPFAIDQAVRDAWVRHMTAAVQSSSASPADKPRLVDYFERTATFLINR